MNLVNKISVLLLITGMTILTACSDSEGENSEVKAESVSFKGLTRAWFSQEPEDAAPTPNDINFVFDADEDANAFSDLITIDNDGVDDV